MSNQMQKTWSTSSNRRIDTKEDAVVFLTDKAFCIFNSYMQGALTKVEADEQLLVAANLLQKLGYQLSLEQQRGRPYVRAQRSSNG